jgi:hypothetical protein
MPWSRAKSIYDEISGAVAAADAENRRRIDAQMDAERDARAWPTKAYEIAKAAVSAA